VELLAFLDKNKGVFAWSISDLVVVTRDAIKHKLQVKPSAKPRKQRLKNMSKEKIEAAKPEVQRLLNTGFSREVTLPQWLANVFIVQKKNGKW
jgi:hypothetical protein